MDAPRARNRLEPWPAPNRSQTGKDLKAITDEEERYERQAARASS